MATTKHCPVSQLSVQVLSSQLQFHPRPPPPQLGPSSTSSALSLLASLLLQYLQPHTWLYSSSSTSHCQRRVCLHVLRLCRSLLSTSFCHHHHVCSQRFHPLPLPLSYYRFPPPPMQIWSYFSSFYHPCYFVYYCF